MKTVYVVYANTDAGEFVFAYFDEVLANKNAAQWGGFATVTPVQVKETEYEAR